LKLFVLKKTKNCSISNTKSTTGSRYLWICILFGFLDFFNNLSLLGFGFSFFFF